MTSRFMDQPSADYRAAVEALRKLPADDRTRAYAEASASEARVDWLAKRKVRPSRARSWQALLGRQHWSDCFKRLPGQDHAEMFIRDGKPAILTFQPYHLSFDTLRALVETCVRNGLRFDIDTRASWYFPGAVALVEVTRTDDHD